LPSWEVEKLITLIERVAAGTTRRPVGIHPGRAFRVHQEDRRGFGLMMVEIEARECYLGKLYDELKSLNRSMQKNIVQTVITIAHSLGARDRYSEGHARRVSRYARRLAQRLDLPVAEVESIRIGGLLHDIGKIGFSDDVFRNEHLHPSKAILKEIRGHPYKGKMILKDLAFLSPIVDYVYCHHEREDGSGYPRGLKGDKIPLGAKIIGIADTFDALTTLRKYQEAKTPEEAFVILENLGGKTFDTGLVSAFISEIREAGM
jgi:putative nucleotidyltransferase with HDIG domain